MFKKVYRRNSQFRGSRILRGGFKIPYRHNRNLKASIPNFYSYKPVKPIKRISAAGGGGGGSRFEFGGSNLRGFNFNAPIPEPILPRVTRSNLRGFNFNAPIPEPILPRVTRSVTRAARAAFRAARAGLPYALPLAQVGLRTFMPRLYTRLQRGIQRARTRSGRVYRDIESLIPVNPDIDFDNDLPFVDASEF